MSKSKNTVNVCVDSTRPPLAILIEPTKKSFLDAKSRSKRLRYLTEITKIILLTVKSSLQLLMICAT